MSVQLPFPINIAREGKWFVASCPLLDIGTQGRSEAEVKEKMADLINDYVSDLDKPSRRIIKQSEKPRSEFE